MSNFIYWTAYWVVTFYLKLFRKLKIYGRENIPEKGAFIVAGNHVSNFDPPVLGVAMTRKVRFMAKKELFKYAPIAWLLHQLGAFPVSRGKADLEAIRTSLEVLKSGGVLGVFPEGTRHKPGKLGRAQPGIVMLALKAKVPILPCALTNTIGGNKPIIVRIGKPIKFTKYYDRKLSKEEIKEVGNLIMNEIANLLEMDRDQKNNLMS
ncbi:hypothetical protein BBF96_04710 [Anoxybacter fermentans]|uniref:1-acyl-sn-glycerol-3-phosphate acyltransferase n=1 Tax=Anoxybacter fermentans TaxID=1323375 RepID=A0A3Q9HPQ6_9FIRM|nr:lysophospholipid acyltransferase family protein [Anoxybacter fermentans]AZR72754.1 hypothetical protein BBF96_04710 [Anoxybacter fermentans]